MTDMPKGFVLRESVVYPNGGTSAFWVRDDVAVIVDDGICLRTEGEPPSAPVDAVLNDYAAFYLDRIERDLPVDRPNCPYTTERLAERRFTLDSMLSNPFEKFERKRFMYYSRDLGQLSMNHALLAALTDDYYAHIRRQLHEDLTAYYDALEG